MKKLAVVMGVAGLGLSAPAYSIVSLHGAVHMAISMFGVNLGLAAAGLAAVAIAVAYRLKKTR